MSSAGLRLPPALRPGDTVALMAPASPASPERWRAARRALECLGYRVRPGRRRSAAPSGYAAGTPEQRAEELNRLFADPGVQAIWCIRGGYTAAELLPLLDYQAIARTPKIFLGYSDITCLHTALNQRCRFVTYHAPMGADASLTEGPDSETAASLRAALSGAARYENPGGPLHRIRPGQAEGILAGGNLTLLTAGLGTPWALEPEGKLLFFEETAEPVPVLRRMLVQLSAAGVFERAAGVLLGSFTDCENRYAPEYGAERLFREFFASCPKPVLAGLACGHCCPNGTLPLGRWGRIADEADGACLLFPETAS